jgi:hypothetical protein
MRSALVWRKRRSKGCILKSLMICKLHQILFEWSNQEERYGLGVLHVCRKGSICAGFWWGNLRERDHLEDPGVDVMIVLKWILKNNDGRWWGVDWMDVV